MFAWPAIAHEDCCNGLYHCEDGICEHGGHDDGSECDCACCNPPPEEGCTPGYWKQEHHFDSWPATLAPENLFVDVFGVDAFPDMTLLDVLEQGGGGLNALGRHSVAGLLNAHSDEVDYQYADSKILDGFEHGWDTGLYGRIKNVFQDANEAGCPLD
jgi:hypothetical protein